MSSASTGFDVISAIGARRRPWQAEEVRLKSSLLRVAWNRLTHGLDRLEAKLSRFADRFHATLSRELEVEVASGH